MLKLGSIICPYELTIAAVGNAMDNGVELKTNFEVKEIKIENDPRTYLIMLEDCERLISDNHSIYEIKLTHLRFNKETEFIDNMISKNYRLWKIDLQIDYSELDDTEEMFSKNKELINVTLRFGKTTIPSLEEMFYKNEDLKTIRIEADTMHIDMSKLNNICYKCQEIQRVIYTTTDASTESNED